MLAKATANRPTNETKLSFKVDLKPRENFYRLSWKSPLIRIARPKGHAERKKPQFSELIETD